MSFSFSNLAFNAAAISRFVPELFKSGIITHHDGITP